MAELKQKLDDSQLHWFWKLTTKWWFFPVFYIILAMVYPIIVLNMEKFQGSSNFKDAYLEVLGTVIVFMPAGLSYYLTLIGLDEDFFATIMVFIFPVFAIGSIILIQLYKLKKKKILKWLIILILLLMILSFFGCIAGAPPRMGF